jgi:predicted DNA-binding transcriptional regulator YafY
MNRTDRLVAMVMFLQGRRVVRAEELAGHFEISVRTVYRDVAALSEAGVPIAGEAGVGYSLMKGYHLPPVMFTAEEASGLFVGGAMVHRFADASLQTPMRSALEKLRAVLPADRQDYVDRLVRNTVINGLASGAGPDPGAQPWLLTVQQGVAQRRVLRMTYHGRDRDEDTCRDAEPLGIVFYGGAWSLVAWCRLRKDIRHFRIDRIRRLEILGERFPSRPGFSLAKHLEESVAQEEIIPVRIWFARRVQDRARRESYATMTAERERAGGAEFSLTTSSLEWAARWVLSFGGEAEALAPARLRELVRQRANELAKQHETNGL